MKSTVKSLAEEITPENIDVLFVEEQLKLLQKRCIHDFVRYLMVSITDVRPSDDPRKVLRSMAAAVQDGNHEDLGIGECDCSKSDCPYLVSQKSSKDEQPKEKPSADHPA